MNYSKLAGLVSLDTASFTAMVRIPLDEAALGVPLTAVEWRHDLKNFAGQGELAVLWTVPEVEALPLGEELDASNDIRQGEIDLARIVTRFYKGEFNLRLTEILIDAGFDPALSGKFYTSKRSQHSEGRAVWTIPHLAPGELNPMVRNLVIAVNLKVQDLVTELADITAQVQRHK